MELETALSKNPTSEESQTTLNMLQEIRQKDNALKKLQKKHDETLMQVKKEVEKQVRVENLKIILVIKINRNINKSSVQITS